MKKNHLFVVNDVILVAFNWNSLGLNNLQYLHIDYHYSTSKYNKMIV